MLIDLLILKKASSINNSAKALEYEFVDDDETDRPYLLMALWLSLLFTWPVLVFSLVKATGRSWRKALTSAVLFGVLMLALHTYTLVGMLTNVITLIWFLVVAVWAATRTTTVEEA